MQSQVQGDIDRVDSLNAQFMGGTRGDQGPHLQKFRQSVVCCSGKVIYFI